MTTEQMNMDIAEYMGFVTESYPNSPVTQFPTGDEILLIHKKLVELITEEDYAIWKGIHTKFDASWDWLMPVWQKLRGELRTLRTNTPITNIRYVQAYDLEISIKEAITEEDTPTTAHKLIYEAITLIKK